MNYHESGLANWEFHWLRLPVRGIDSGGNRRPPNISTMRASVSEVPVTTATRDLVHSGQIPH